MKGLLLIIKYCNFIFNFQVSCRLSSSNLVSNIVALLHTNAQEANSTLLLPELGRYIAFLHSPSRNHRQGNHHLAAFEIESNETADYSTRDSRIPAPRCNVNKPGNLQLSHFASDSEFLHWRAKEQLVDKNISTMTLHELRRRRRQILMSILLHQSHSPQYSNIHK